MNAYTVNGGQFLNSMWNTECCEWRMFNWICLSECHAAGRRQLQQQKYTTITDTYTARHKNNAIKHASWKHPKRTYAAASWWWWWPAWQINSARSAAPQSSNTCYNLKLTATAKLAVLMLFPCNVFAYQLNGDQRTGMFCILHAHFFVFLSHIAVRDLVVCAYEKMCVSVTWETHTLIEAPNGASRGFDQPSEIFFFYFSGCCCCCSEELDGRISHLGGAWIDYCCLWVAVCVCWQSAIFNIGNETLYSITNKQVVAEKKYKKLRVL